MLTRLGIRLVLFLVIVTTIGCDRVTKHVATETLAGKPTQSYLSDTLRLGYTENTGAFLSIGDNLPLAARTALFTVATGFVLVVLAIVVCGTRLRPWRRIGLALFVAGGTSNWIDRVLHGSVVDFLNIGVGWLRTGVFNVADVAIMLGAGLFVLSELRRNPHRSSGGK